MDPARMDALLSIMAPDELDEALDVIRERLAEGLLSAEEARGWERRILAWAAEKSEAGVTEPAAM